MTLIKLLNPGPVTLTARVRAALGRPDLCHREPEFEALQTRIRAGLARVYAEAAAEYEAVLLTGSGTAAVEAMVGSLVPRQGHALVVANGVYGERMAAMLTAQGKRMTLLRADWTAPMELAAVDSALAAGGLTHVLAVQHETTTGRRNDVAALGALCRRHGVPLLLDAVSSFGGEPIEFEAWNLQALAATANKCLHGAPGVSFVLARRQVLEETPSGATSLYLDVMRQYLEQKHGSSPFTQAVHACFALDEALAELADEGGWPRRHARYRALSLAVLQGLQALGVEPLLERDEDSSVILRAYRMPAGGAYAALHDALKAAGFVIYAGQGRFAGEIFRIAVMGDLDLSDMARLLAAAGAFFTAVREDVPDLGVRSRDAGEAPPLLAQGSLSPTPGRGAPGGG